MLLIVGLDLFPGERCTVLAGHCLERDDIAFPQARDRAVDRGCHSLAHADLSRDLVCDAGVRAQTHPAKNETHLLVIHDLEKR